MLIIAISKFLDGTWLTLMFVLGPVMGFHQIQEHYQEAARELSLPEDLILPAGLPTKPRIVIPVSGVHHGTVEAVHFAHAIGQ